MGPGRGWGLEGDKAWKGVGPGRGWGLEEDGAWKGAGKFASHNSLQPYFFLSRYRSAETVLGARMYVLRSTRRNNVDRIAKPKPHPSN